MLAVPKFTTCDLLQSHSIGLKKGPEGFAKECGRQYSTLRKVFQCISANGPRFPAPPVYNEQSARQWLWYWGTCTMHPSVRALHFYPFPVYFVKGTIIEASCKEGLKQKREPRLRRNSLQLGLYHTLRFCQVKSGYPMRLAAFAQEGPSWIGFRAGRWVFAQEMIVKFSVGRKVGAARAAPFNRLLAL
jgi:hypothetical protein